MIEFHRVRPANEGCLSELKLDQLQAGVLQSEHVATCVLCTQRMELRAKGFAALPQLDSVRLLAKIRRGLSVPVASWWERLVGRAFVVTALAAGVAFIASSQLRTTVEVTRLKGGPVLHVFRLTEGKGREVASGEHFAPGDRLRFAVDVSRSSRVRVYGQEEGRALYTAWPLEPTAYDVVAQGAQVELPGAVVLDESLGTETLWLVACAPEIEPACATEHAAGLKCSEGCSISPFVMKKAP